ncbi:MAG: hypothetical protein HRU70_13315 [Phycisphaeraceae bacterium]|nr:MAG: hypothetical protein HRU70_13315 [Phycisphaeraceae bacterium]
MPSAFTIRAPDGYHLPRDACSYGYFLLAPNHWDVQRQSLRRTFDLAGTPVTVEIAQPRAAENLRVTPDRTLGARHRATVEPLIRRMLSLDEPADAIAEFHRLDPRWKAAGRGRLMRSPTMFEDVIKTVTSCNVTWPSTVVMNRRLCEVLGAGGLAFPTPRALADTRPQTLRARCRVGYRDQRIIDLARLFTSGQIDPYWFEDPATPDDAVRDALLDLPGIGPYAAANIMQLLGRYAHLPLDTESLRHARSVLKFKGEPPALMKRLHRHYAPFGPHRFRSYWLELWDFYESRHGPAHTWERDSTGSLFTAAHLADAPRPRGTKKKRGPVAGPAPKVRVKSKARA